MPSPNAQRARLRLYLLSGCLAAIVGTIAVGWCISRSKPDAYAKPWYMDGPPSYPVGPHFSLKSEIQLMPPIWPAKREEIKAATRKCFPKLVELSESGDLFAQTALALHGDDVESLGGAISAEERRKWAETVYSRRLKLAESGDAASQAFVAHCLEYGQLIPKDVAAAFRWYRKAAEAGLPLAQQALCKMYADGRGTSVDLAQAEYWRKKADLQFVKSSHEKK